MCGHTEPNMACGMIMQTKTVEKVSEKQSRLKSCQKHDKKACKNTEKDFKTLKRIRNMAQSRRSRRSTKKLCKPPTESNLLQSPSHS
jgi:hypothetical protein